MGLADHPGAYLAHRCGLKQPEHGFYESPWGKHPRIQVLTVASLLDGVKFDAPPIRAGGTTFKLPRRVAKEKTQGILL